MKVITIITGILTAILGIAAMFMPIRVFLGLGWLVGAILMVNGIEMSINGFSGKKNVSEGLLGILVSIGGLILLFNTFTRVLTDLMIVYFVGGSIIVSGIYLIVHGVKSYKEAKGSAFVSIILAVLEILAGVFAMMHPVLTMLSVGLIISINLIMQGVSLTTLGFTMKKEAAE